MWLAVRGLRVPGSKASWQNCRKAVTQSLRPKFIFMGSGVAGGLPPSSQMARGRSRGIETTSLSCELLS